MFLYCLDLWFLSWPTTTLTGLGPRQVVIVAAATEHLRCVWRTGGRIPRDTYLPTYRNHLTKSLRGNGLNISNKMVDTFQPIIFVRINRVYFEKSFGVSEQITMIPKPELRLFPYQTTFWGDLGWGRCNLPQVFVMFEKNIPLHGELTPNC